MECADLWLSAFCFLNVCFVFFGVGVSERCSPRVARGSQPWALSRNPFGIQRQKARWFCNPKGIVSSSPGLTSPRGYPGLATVQVSTPTGLCPIAA